MATKYAVLWGQRGVKDFRKLSIAKKFARTKANKSKKKVEIDKIKTYPKARKGETDWSQSHHSYVSPRRKRKRK